MYHWKIIIISGGKSYLILSRENNSLSGGGRVGPSLHRTFAIIYSLWSNSILWCTPVRLCRQENVTESPGFPTQPKLARVRGIFPGPYVVPRPLRGSGSLLVTGHLSTLPHPSLNYSEVISHWCGLLRQAPFFSTLPPSTGKAGRSNCCYSNKR